MPLVPLATRSAELSTGGNPSKRLAAKAAGEGNMPQVCILSGPHVISHCCGKYVMSRETANGLPVWINQKASMFLCSDSDEGWSIVTQRRGLTDISTNSIVTSQARHNGQPPQQIKDWCYGDGRVWIPCTEIEFHVPDCEETTLTSSDSQDKKRKQVNQNIHSAHINTQPATATNAAVVRLPVDDFQVDYPYRYDNKSYLTRKELKWLKRAYDEGASRLAINNNLELLRSALQRLGMLGSADLPQLADAVRKAVVLVNKGNAQHINYDNETYSDMEKSKSLEELQKSLTLMEFFAVCDVLKARNKTISEYSTDADMLDAFVAMGGNRDQTGNITIEFLQDAAEGFQLKLDNAMLQDLDKDSNGIVDYCEFNTLLQSAATGAIDTFRLAGGSPENPHSTVRTKQLLAALRTLIEVGGVTQVNPVTWNLLCERVDDNKEMTLREFAEHIWLPLGLPEEMGISDVKINDREGQSGTLPPRSTSSHDMDIDDNEMSTNAALSLAAMFVGRKSKHYSKGELQSVALQRRFEVLCRRLKHSTTTSTSQHTKDKCTWHSSPLRHTFYYSTDLLRRFLALFNTRFPSVTQFKRRVLSSISSVVIIIDDHDNSCIPCKQALKEERECLKSLRGMKKNVVSISSRHKLQKTPTVSATYQSTRDAVDKAVSRSLKGRRWRIEPAPPPIQQNKSKVFSRTATGGITIEEFTNPVYVDSKGRTVPPPRIENTHSCKTTTSIPRVANWSVASATCGFLSRGGNTRGQVPVRRVKRVIEDECFQESHPTTENMERNDQIDRISPPPIPSNRQQYDSDPRSVEVIVRRSSEDVPLGLAFSKELLLQSVIPASPSSRAGLSKLSKWKLTHVNHIVTTSVSHAEQLMEGHRELTLCFSMGPVMIKRRPPPIDYKPIPMPSGTASDLPPGTLLKLMRKCQLISKKKRTLIKKPRQRMLL